jgi:diguanylate cyclase (GGDEF)-like protein
MANRKSEIQLQFFEDLVRFAPVAIVAVDDDGLIRFHNQSAADLFQTRLELYADKKVDELLAGIDLASMRKEVDAIEVVPYGSARKHFVDCQQRKIQTEDGVWTILYMSDAEPRREKELKLEAEASTDVLSGLLNRRGFQKSLERNIDSRLTVAILDVDQFKPINDQFGHAVGDEAIQFVSKLLVDHFRDSAICISRFGGDEFGLIFINVDDRQKIESEFENFRRLMATEKFSANRLTITISVGLAISKVSSTTARELLTTADVALYRAKEGGRDKICSTIIEN